MKRLNLTISVLVAATLGVVVAAHAQSTTPTRGDKLKTVDVERLTERPQDYWSLGIAFSDRVESATGRRVKVGKRTFYQVKLDRVGKALVNDKVWDYLEDKDPIGKEYIFSGTVLHEKSGMFGGRDTYHVVINKALRAAVEGPDSISDQFANLSMAGANPETRMLMDIFSSTQRDIITFAEDHNTSVTDVFDPDSEHYNQARDIIRRALRRMEITGGIPGNEILTGFVFFMLGERMGVEVDLDTESPAPVPEPIETMDETPAPPVSDTTVPDEAITADPIPADELPASESVQEPVQEEPAVSVEMEEPVASTDIPAELEIPAAEPDFPVEEEIDYEVSTAPAPPTEAPTELRTFPQPADPPTVDEPEHSEEAAASEPVTDDPEAVDETHEETIEDPLPAPVIEVTPSQPKPVITNSGTPYLKAPIFALPPLDNPVLPPDHPSEIDADVPMDR